MPPVSVNLCVVLLEIEENCSFLSSLYYIAPKYRNMAQGAPHLEFESTEKSQAASRGLRSPHTITLETFVRNADLSSNDASQKEGAEEAKPEVKLQKVKYHSGNPDVEITIGILHLYKEDERTSIDSPDEVRSEMLVMIGVPASVSCRDLLQFVAPYQDTIEHIKIIRDSVPNQYMVLVKFTSQQDADSFYSTLNGTPYNSFEEDVCTLAYVSRVETVKESDGVGLPLVGHTELPTCPVCLERMDESVDGVLTILCNHSFHSVCLAKWSDARCPVCRFVQTPEMVTQNQCFECKSSDSLWICLICGHIGCGRYAQGHAFKHFCETSHCYAIQPDNNRVWDYIGDNFVHRLLSNKDGKLVQVGGRNALDASDGCDDNEEKLDSVQVEFTYILQTQLEEQRKFFEEKLAQQAQDTDRELEKLNIKLEESCKGKEEVSTKLKDLVKEKAVLERKVSVLSEKLAKAYADLKDEKALNKHLQGDQEKWRKMLTNMEETYEKYVKEKTAEITELKEQLRDVMFYLEGQKVVESSKYKDEIAEGSVVLGEAKKPRDRKKRHN